MNISQINIKMNQTNLQNGGRTNSTSGLGASGNSFDQVLAMFNILGQTLGSEKQSAGLSIPKVTNQFVNNYLKFLNNNQEKALFTEVNGNELTDLAELGGIENKIDFLEEIPINSENINSSINSHIPINIENSQNDSSNPDFIGSETVLAKTEVNNFIESDNQKNDLKKLTDEDLGKIDTVINSLISLMEQIQQLKDTMVAPHENVSDQFINIEQTELLVPPLVGTSDSPKMYQSQVEHPSSTMQGVSDSTLVYQRPVEQLAPLLHNTSDLHRGYQRPVEQPLTKKNSSDSPMMFQRTLDDNIAKSIQKVSEIIDQVMEEERPILPQRTNQILLDEIKGNQSFDTVQKFEENIQIILNGLKSEKQSGTIEHNKIEQNIPLDKNQVFFSSMPQQVNPEKNQDLRESSIPKVEDKQKINDQTILLNQQSRLTENVLKAENSPNRLEISEFSKEVSEWISRFMKITNGKSGSTEAKFSLFPEHLGHIEIKVTTQQGMISAQIVTDTTMAKDALEGQLQHLKQALQQSGLQVQKLDVAQQTSINTDSSQSGLAFSQDGSHSSRQQRSYTASLNTRNEQNEFSEQRENEGEITPITYGGTAQKSSSRIDFTA